jgi:hypothetical protein
LIALLLSAAGCQTDNTWRSITNLPEYEGACVELTVECPFQASNDNYYLIDPPIAYLFPEISGTLPAGQQLKIISITPGKKGTGLVNVAATAKGGTQSGKKFNISQLFENTITADGKRQIYTFRASLRRCPASAD